MAVIIDGKRIASQVRAEATEAASVLASSGVKPGLAVILVGDDPASASYVRMKGKDCLECGIETFDEHLPATIGQEELEALVTSYNENPAVHGILVQMPLPEHLDEERIVARIDPAKDVDGFGPDSLGRLVRGVTGFRPCTPSGVMRLLDEYGIDPAGKHAVVVGRSAIVGKPLALMLLERDATVVIAHSHTVNTRELCSQADILVVGVGSAELIDESFVKPGAVVIDIGVNRNDEGRMVGDVDFSSVESIASAITPVPGGVGPMTRAMLMLNTVDAAAAQTGCLSS